MEFIETKSQIIKLNYHEEINITPNCILTVLEGHFIVYVDDIKAYSFIAPLIVTLTDKKYRLVSVLDASTLICTPKIHD